MDKRKRLQVIRRSMKQHGLTVQLIAERADVSREWVSKVLHGHQPSEKVLRVAESLIAEREIRS